MFGGATICNLLQVRSASRLNNVFTLLKLTTALAFGGLVFFSPHTSIQNVFAIASPSGSTNIAANVAAVLPLAMGGFSGIEMSGCTASETADARKTVPRAIFSALITVSLVYVGMCIAVASTSPFALNVDKTMAVIPGTDVIATAPALGGYLGGPLCGFLFTAGVIFSITSCALSGVMAGARTSLSMAQTGLFPEQFARLNPGTKVPDYGLVFQFVFMTGTGIGAHLLSRLGLFPDAYIFLGTAGCVLYGVLAMLYGVCLVSLRFTDPNLPRAFKLGNNAIACTVAAIAVAVYAFVAFGCTHWSHQLAALVFLLMGVPVYRSGRTQP